MGKKKSGKKLRKKEVWGESPCEPPVFPTDPVVVVQVDDECVDGINVSDVEIKTEEGLEVVVACDTDGLIEAEKSLGGVEGDLGNVASKNIVRTMHKKWKNSSKCLERGTKIATLAKNCPSIRPLHVGFDLNEIPDQFGRYTSPCPWDARQFANGMSSGFSSFSMAENVDGSIVSNANFVGDWENIKELITSQYSDDSRSFFLHKSGKSIFVDRFDLKSVLSPPFYSDWPWLRQFALNYCQDQKSIIMREKKSENEIMCKARYLKLLYFGANEMLQFGVPEKKKLFDVVNDGKDEFLRELELLPPESKLRGANKKFLHTRVIKFGGFSILAGTDVPIFQEPSTNKDEMRKISMRLIDSASSSSSLDSLTAMDLWLDNLLLDLPKTCIVDQADGIVESSTIIDTDDLPCVGSYDPEPMIQEASFLLKHLISGVSECGHTYWLFRPHGATEFKIFDLTALSAQSKEKENSMAKPVTQNPHQLVVGTHIFRSAIAHVNLWKTSTYESMLRHAAYLLQDTQPLIPIASRILMSITRNTFHYPCFQPNLYYDWPEEMDYIFRDVLSEDLMNAYIVILCLEKLDMGDGKLYEELMKPVNAAVNLSKYDLGTQAVEKNCSLIAHFLWSKRQCFPHKTSNAPIASFKVDRIATHEIFETTIEALKSTDAKKLRKLETQIRRDRTKNLNERCAKSNAPYMSEKQHKQLKMIVHMKSVRCPDMNLSVRQWADVISGVMMAVELVTALRDLVKLEDKCKPSVAKILKIQIVTALGNVCRRLADNNTDINSTAITSFLYEILYGVPLMTQFGVGVLSSVAETLIYNAKEVVFDGIQTWEMHRQNPSSTPISLVVAKELQQVQNSRIYMNLVSTIEDCKHRLSYVLDSIRGGDGDKNGYPEVPMYKGDLPSFYSDMMNHYEALARYMPNNIHDIEIAKSELAKDCRTADVNMQINGDKILKFCNVPILRTYSKSSKPSTSGTNVNATSAAANYTTEPGEPITQEPMTQPHPLNTNDDSELISLSGLRLTRDDAIKTFAKFNEIFN